MEKIKKINLKPDQFYSQLNNQYDDPNTPMHERYVACGPTSRVMFYLGNGIPYSNTSDMTDDDFFMKLMRSDPAYEYADSHYKPLSKNYPPNEIHYMYPNWLDKMVCGRTVSKFYETGLTFKRAIDYMKAGTVLMVNGKFPKAKIDGHVFCLIGHMGDDLLIIADPYGNFHNNYKKGSGYGVTMTKEEFNFHLKWGKTKGYHAPI